MNSAKSKSLNEVLYITSILTCMVILIHTGSEPLS